MLEHEYTLLGGLSRARVGRYLSLLAAGISAMLVFIVLSLIDLAKQFGLPANLTPSIMSLLGAGAVFTLLYWTLDHHAWKWEFIGKLLKVPDLSGEWLCKGQTIDTNGRPKYDWEATITIVQSWDRLRVRLKTQQSGSNSKSAALIYDEADGFRLFYSYVNDPKIGEQELKSHRGFAEITFNKDLLKGYGEYFNGHGRYTFGRMELTRI